MNGIFPRKTPRIRFLAILIFAFGLFQINGTAQNNLKRQPENNELKISLVRLSCPQNDCSNDQNVTEETLQTEFIDLNKLTRINVKGRPGDMTSINVEFALLKFRHAPDENVRLKFESRRDVYVNYAIVNAQGKAMATEPRKSDQPFEVSDSKNSLTVKTDGETMSYVVFVSTGTRLQETSFNEILVSGRDAKMVTGSAMMSNLGAVYSAAGNYQKSVAFYEAYLLFVKSKGAFEIAAAHNNLGLAHYAFSRFDAALENYQQALKVLAAMPSGDLKRIRGEAAAFDNLGGVYNSLARFDLAIENYQNALTRKRQLNDKEGEFLVLNNLGAAHNLPGKYDQAIGYYDQAIKLAVALKDERGRGVALKNKASALKAMGNFAAAEVLIKQSLELSDTAGNELAKAFAYNLRGQIAFARKNYAEAIKNYNLALDIYRAEKNRAAESVIYNNLMFSYAAQNNLNLAVLYGKRSINLVQVLRREIDKLEAETQTSFAESRVFTFRKLADLLISQGRLDEAQAILDLLKKEEFGGRTVRGGAGDALIPYSQAEAEIAGLIDALSGKLAEIAALKRKIKNQTATDAEKAALQNLQTKVLPSATGALDKALAALVVAQPDVKLAVEKLKNSNIKTGLNDLPAGAIALYTLVGRDEQRKINAAWVILIRPESDVPSKAYAIDITDLETTIFNFRQSLRRAYYDPQPLAASLYNKIFRHKTPKQTVTLEEDLKSYFQPKNQKELTVMWSLDGILRYIPPAALHDGEKYLAEKYRHTAFNPQSMASLSKETRPNWEVLGLGVSEEREVTLADGKTKMIFPALTGSKNELNKLIKESNADAGILSGTIKMDAAFKKADLTALQNMEAEEKPAVVHISSHFAFNPANETTSFLLLGDGDKFDLAEFETAGQLFQNVDLLVLSACDTATTARADAQTQIADDGRDVESFGFKAQEKGARSVLASLWQVADIGTDELMLAFYRIRQENSNITKGEAFRRAQLALLNGEVTRAIDGETLKGAILLNQPGKTVLNLKRFRHDPAKPFAHPHFWSPFILIGNWK